MKRRAVLCATLLLAGCSNARKDAGECISALEQQYPPASASGHPDTIAAARISAYGCMKGRGWTPVRNDLCRTDHDRYPVLKPACFTRG